MQDRVLRDRVRLAAPRMQRLSAEQEHEATRLLAGAAERHGVKTRPGARAARCSVPASVRSSGWTRGPSSVEIPSKQAISTAGKQPRQ
jgi:hypothetical protein